MNTKWQTTRPTVKERSQYMFNNKYLSDVEFSVVNSKGDTITIPAHKYPLAIGSPVFGAMFYGDLAENDHTISLPDCTAEGLLKLFRYLYYDEVELTGSVVMEVLYLAKKYIVPSLVEKCTHYLEEELGPEDVLGVLPEVEKLEDEKLQNICWNVVDTETRQTVTSAPFYSVTQETLCDILERDTLDITEIELFHAVDCWAENIIQEQELDEGGQSKRAVLGDEVIQLIRFPLMSMSQFVDNVLPTEILDVKEVTEMYTYHNSGDKQSLTIFDGELRVGSEPAVCKRFTCYGTIDWDSVTDGTVSDGIGFTTDRKIHLIGFALYGDDRHEYNANCFIFSGGQTLVATGLQRYRSERNETDGYYSFTVILDEPLSVDANIKYTIQAYIEGPKSYCGYNGKRSVQCKNVTFTFKECPANRTNCDRGQFPELLFY